MRYIMLVCDTYKCITTIFLFLFLYFFRFHEYMNCNSSFIGGYLLKPNNSMFQVKQEKCFIYVIQKLYAYINQLLLFYGRRIKCNFSVSAFALHIIYLMLLICIHLPQSRSIAVFRFVERWRIQLNYLQNWCILMLMVKHINIWIKMRSTCWPSE